MICKIDIMAKPRMTRRDKWPPPRKCVAKYWKFKDELVACAKKEGFILGDRIYMEFNLLEEVNPRLIFRDYPNQFWIHSFQKIALSGILRLRNSGLRNPC